VAHTGHPHRLDKGGVFARSRDSTPGLNGTQLLPTVAQSRPSVPFTKLGDQTIRRERQLRGSEPDTFAMYGSPDYVARVAEGDDGAGHSEGRAEAKPDQ
jgi:hypothetical protein